jgi:membrane protease YdiL (CAAX protease family)
MAGMSAPATQSPRRFNAAQALVIFLAYVGVQLAIGFAVGLVFAIGYGVTHHGKIDHLADAMQIPVTAGAFAGVLAGGAAVWWLARRAARRDLHQPTLSLFGWAPSAPRPMLAGACAGLAIGVAYMALVAVFPPPPDWRQGLIVRTLSVGGWPLYVWAAFAVAVAPPVEEFVFRGVLWTGMKRSWGPVAAALAVTAIFVLLHVNEAGGYPLALAAIGSLGLGALAARVLSGSLLPAVLLHAGYNCVVMAATIMGKG